jgi:hypothetical protein
MTRTTRTTSSALRIAQRFAGFAGLAGLAGLAITLLAIACASPRSAGGGVRSTISTTPDGTSVEARPGRAPAPDADTLDAGTLLDFRAVRFALDSMSTWGATLGVDPIGCVAWSMYRGGPGAEGVLRAVYIFRRVHALPCAIDEVTARGRLVRGQGGAAIHWLDAPIAADTLLAERSRAPFHLLLVGGTDRVVIYRVDRPP